MKSAAIVSFAFFVSSILLPAQNASYGVAGMEDLSQPGESNQITAAQSSANAHGCPVSLRAQHGAGGGLQRADRNHSNGPGQMLHLTLADSGGLQIVSAQVRVHGLSGRGRSAQTTSESVKPDSTRTLTIRFSPDTPRTVAGDLWVPSMTAVLTIDLNSVTFSDGNTRAFTPRDGCHVAPDLKMLIADR